jgi:tRNA pseudouridine38-40 synthase
VAYEGTAFAGWQRQAGERTVQAVLEEALSSIDERAVEVVGAGRTDAGVHALGQVASSRVASRHTPAVWHRALNARLDDDVRVIAVEEAAPEFDARRDARFKTYHYAIAPGPPPDPFVRRVVWHVPHRLDVEAMRRAASLLVGEHDFAAFQASGGDVRTSVRRLVSSEVVRGAGAPGRAGVFVHYRTTGTGFLRHMVRNIVGTLVDIGRGRWPAEDIVRILASRDRARAGATAPPHGLVLVRVWY